MMRLIKQDCNDNVLMRKVRTDNMTQVIKNIEELKKSNVDLTRLSVLKEKQLDALSSSKIYNLGGKWTFDACNAAVNAPHKRFYLTQKEILFLKMLIKNEKITTYKEMIEILWHDKKNVSLNAVRLFTKDLKKKLPTKILKNFQDIGYKLDL